jgi:hypothetical protein
MELGYITVRHKASSGKVFTPTFKKGRHNIEKNKPGMI